jgi:hypothetical protein
MLGRCCPVQILLLEKLGIEKGLILMQAQALFKLIHF